ncbi:MAG TPA: rhamnan synthesis F family protein [Mesorhizobium sp.]
MNIKRLKAIALLPIRRVVRFVHHDVKVMQARRARAAQGAPSLKASHQGAREHTGGVYAIFLIWQRRQVPWYVQNALTALDEAGVNVILVVNHELEGERLRELTQQSARVLIRDNSGFDIGGYRDGTLYVQETFKPSRVLYLNDSIYYFKDNLTGLFNAMAQSDADVAAPFENHEYTYHVQSFCFSVAEHIFQSTAFLDFWRGYLPVDSRLWAINEGEIGLSNALAPQVRTKDIFYTPEKLRPFLTGLSLDELRHLNVYLPRLSRMEQAELTAFTQPELVDQFCRLVAVRSQIHTGAFLYQRFMGCPLMKRDLLYRLQFSLEEITANLAEVRRDEHFREILEEMKTKGTGRDLSIWNYVRFAEGVL